MNSYNVFVRLKDGGLRDIVIEAPNHKEAFVIAKNIIGEENWLYAGIPVEQIYTKKRAS